MEGEIAVFGRSKSKPTQLDEAVYTVDYLQEVVDTLEKEKSLLECEIVQQTKTIEKLSSDMDQATQSAENDKKILEK